MSGCMIIQPNGSIGPTDAASLANLSVETIFCVDEINRYRATVDMPALTRSTELESYAAESARVDGLAGNPTSIFRRPMAAGSRVRRTSSCHGRMETFTRSFSEDSA